MRREGRAATVYRVRIDASGDGDVARSATTGYFAHAVAPTAIVISVNTSSADFSPEFISMPSHSTAPRVCGTGGGVQGECQGQNLQSIEG